MPRIVYRLQPWAFVDRLVLDLCPAGFEILPLARDATPEQRAELLSTADFLMGSWVTTAVTLTDADYAAAPRLKLVQLMSAGYEHVDLALAARHGVPVATFGDAMASVVAEHVLAPGGPTSRRCASCSASGLGSLAWAISVAP